MEILVLCTGNQCRSPMAQVLLQHRLDQAGVPATVSSAGELRSGIPAADGSLRAMAARGLDLSGHRSRTVTRSDLEDADLVLAMARRHVREAAITSPGAWPRTFTLKELVRRGEAAAPRRPDQSFSQWLALVHLGRRPTDLLGDSPEDDIKDPIGTPDPVYEATAVEIDDLMARLVAVAFPHNAPRPDTLTATKEH